jgi:hypothetical protein
VAALIALVTPLPYSADFRPYFTIHDAAFAKLASGQLPDAANGLPRLLGVTNLYFLKVLCACFGCCTALYVCHCERTCNEPVEPSSCSSS